jgi:2',3'-cyclic-nucleotide 2'-phosphodiesterase (5'-nucleotidase family)
MRFPGRALVFRHRHMPKPTAAPVAITRGVVSGGVALLLLGSVAIAQPGVLGRIRDRSATVTISILATTDLHGVALPSQGQGGLPLLGGYANALRAARRLDGGAVLLVDAGDAFQGGIESDLSEGALVVDAYNALGYTAAAIGNHEFDFGAADFEGAREGDGDRRGALKARARQARFPYLAANLVDEATGRVVEWPKVRPSVVVEAAGIKIGIVGVMTSVALRATLPANAHGLRVAPLASTVAAEAAKLRYSGVDVVLVVAHAGGRCTAFGNPLDLSSCDEDAEIFQVARSLPRGLVDVIAAGHSHEAVAHQIEGITVVQAYSRGQAFARADVVLNRTSKRVIAIHPFAPHPLCAVAADAAGCRQQEEPSSAPPLRYEGQPIVPDPEIVAAMAPALARVRHIQAMPLGVVLDTMMPRAADPESPLGNLFADALRHGSAGADVAITNNSFGGLRADLPIGPLTFGRLYDVFPFDNRAARVTVTGLRLAHALAEQIDRRGPGGLAISGLRVQASCGSAGREVRLVHLSGRPVDDTEPLVVATVDTLASGMFAAGRAAADAPVLLDEGPLLRELVEDWLRHRGGHLRLDQFVEPDHPRWQYAGGRTTLCGQ